MKLFSALLCAPLLLTGHAAQAQKAWSQTLTSPDRALSIVVEGSPAPDSSLSQLHFRVVRHGVTVVGDSPLGITLAGDGGDFTHSLSFLRKVDRRVSDHFTLYGGKQRDCRDDGNERVLAFRNAAGRELQLALRAYNDGVALRYQLPGTGPVTINSEATAFQIAPGSTGWVASYHPNYEAFYPQGKVGQDFTGGDLAMPALFDVGQGQFVLLHEAGVTGDYCSSHLGGSAGGLFPVKYPDANLPGTLPRATPWRVVVTGTLPQVVQTTLIQALSPAAMPGDVNWIRPGRVAWSWWSQDTGSPDLQKHYVDFASSVGWEYNLVDAGWPDWNNHDPGPDVKDLVQYAAGRNVGILLWAHHTELDTPEKCAAKLPLWRSWGVQGIKVDFFDSDAQHTMREREMILKSAWDNHLMVNFHGDQSPRGQERAWPNFLTREGVQGAEYYKFGPYPTPTYNCTLPFTRNVMGPMDYTPVTFSTPHRTTTAAHELALAVVFQSGWQHFADSPESYRRHPLALGLLQAVPTAWDETRLLDGYPGQFACLARRKGDTWFVGMNNATNPRTVQLSLSFLPHGDYQLELYRDGAEPDSIERQQSVVRSSDMLPVAVPANGGFACRLVKITR